MRKRTGEDGEQRWSISDASLQRSKGRRRRRRVVSEEIKTHPEHDKEADTVLEEKGHEQQKKLRTSEQRIKSESDFSNL